MAADGTDAGVSIAPIDGTDAGVATSPTGLFAFSLIASHAPGILMGCCCTALKYRSSTLDVCLSASTMSTNESRLYNNQDLFANTYLVSSSLRASVKSLISIINIHIYARRRVTHLLFPDLGPHDISCAIHPRIHNPSTAQASGNVLPF